MYLLFLLLLIYCGVHAHESDRNGLVRVEKDKSSSQTMRRRRPRLHDSLEPTMLIIPPNGEKKSDKEGVIDISEKLRAKRKSKRRSRVLNLASKLHNITAKSQSTINGPVIWDPMRSPSRHDRFIKPLNLSDHDFLRYEHQRQFGIKLARLQQRSLEAANHKFTAQPTFFNPSTNILALNQTSYFILQNPKPHPLWFRLFSDTSPPYSFKPPIVLTLPTCLKNKFVYVYNLPFEFHGGLLNVVETFVKGRNESRCDFGRTSCKEDPQFRGNTYSTYRQHAAEVVLLYKLLLLPRTNDPSKAYLFVVPFLGATAKLVDECPYSGTPCRQAVIRINRMMGHLTHFNNPEYRSKHLFLSTRDMRDSSLNFLSHQYGAIVLHYGPKLYLPPKKLPEVVVPPIDAGFGYVTSINDNGIVYNIANAHQKSRPIFIFVLFQVCNDIRRKWNKILTEIKSSSGNNLKILMFNITDRQSSTDLSLKDAQLLMEDAIFCPIPQGDLPYQHRFFDAIVSGCIPVVILNRIKVWNGTCHVHFYERFSVDKEMFSPFACIDLTYPFASIIPWKEIVFEIPSQIFDSSDADKKVASLLKSISPQDIKKRQNLMHHVKNMLLYDRSGFTFDAFSATMLQVCDINK